MIECGDKAFHRSVVVVIAW